MSNLKIGDKAIDFNLLSTDEENLTLESFKDKKAFAIIFTCNHCPYVMAWEDRIINLQNEYKDKEALFTLICSNDAAKYPEDSFEKMKERAKEKNYPFPYLHDETQEIAKLYGAERTPEIFLFDSKRRLCYHGAFDDNYEEPSSVNHQFFRDAINEVLVRKIVSTPDTAPVGCTIKWK